MKSHGSPLDTSQERKTPTLILLKLASYSKFVSTDSGLGFQIIKPWKFRNFKEKYELEEEVKATYSDSFRNFREYESLRNGEIAVTIEYW